MTISRWVLAALLTIPGYAQAQDRFDHWEHRGLFPRCASCHAGIQDQAEPVWLAPGACADCHDGSIAETVRWQPPAALPATNLRFTHRDHAEAVRRTTGADSLLDCRSCHAGPGADRMQVRLAVAQNCLDCHGVRARHLEAPDTSCATCHLPLARAVRLARADVADFPEPESHKAPGFELKGHGRLARGSGTSPVSAACATCHARDFCSECHVNAPEVPAIQALALDPRSLAHKAELKAPPSHADPSFLQRHGRAARQSPMTCATCHAQESCLACHAGKPATALAMPAAGPGRGKGAVIRRERPPSHGSDFSELHGPVANARPETCNGCHVRPQCLDCHRPTAADAAPGYHPAGFLSRHPAAAYSRETSCSDCHNRGQFCADCHVNAGLSASRTLDAGYHDAKRSFLFGHGQAARQNLESCVACHAERDCLTCHSALGGRRFNPHGPGFDPATLRRKNSQACTACHGGLIPAAPNP
ncbi:MAG TPA: hypothetical protein VF252_06890 [Gemmatimonadales bacterium]